MKKILVVLLILAVAGGVFAQGNWSFGGNVQLGATLDFNTDDAVFEGNPVFIPRNFSAYARDGGVNRADLGLSYSQDGFGAGLDFRTVDGIIAKMSYYGDNYSLGGVARLNALLTSGARDWTDKLEAWGQYSMLNGMVDLVAGVSKWISDPWASNLSFRIFRDQGSFDLFDLQGDDDGGSPGSYPNPQRTHVWANFCCRSGIMANFNFSGISFGGMLRSTPQRWKNEGSSLFFWEGPGGNQLDLINDVLGSLILGMKFDFYPISVGAQFNLEKYGAYIGLNWAFTDSITAGLSFLGAFKDDETTTPRDTTAAFAASLAYGVDAFGVLVEGGYYYDAAVAEASETGNGGIVGIAPSVWFNVIPSHLQVNLAGDFKFGEDGFGWKFIPGLLWNFKGTGAGDWSTGIGLHYVLYKAYGATNDEVNNNEANITFRWAF